MGVWEIELKALLTKEKHDALVAELGSKLKEINKDTIHTTKYTPGDIRLRYSDKICEVIVKKGDPTSISREEIEVPIEKSQLETFKEILVALGFKADPSWIKYKHEYEIEKNGYRYIICLQDIEKFAYILEVEILLDEADDGTHHDNIHDIIKDLGCEPIEPEEFKEKIKEYIKVNG